VIDFRVVTHRGQFRAVPLTERALDFARTVRLGSFLRFVRDAHDAGLVVG
jgi:hypothetical protein